MYKGCWLEIPLQIWSSIWPSRKYSVLLCFGRNLCMYIFGKEMPTRVCFGAAWDWSLEFRCMHGKYPCVAQLTCAPISIRKGCRLPSYGKFSCTCAALGAHKSGKNPASSASLHFLSNWVLLVKTGGNRV